MIIFCELKLWLKRGKKSIYQEIKKEREKNRLKRES